MAGSETLTFSIIGLLRCGKSLSNMLRLVNSNRLVNLGISKQQHLYLKTKNLI